MINSKEKVLNDNTQKLLLWLFIVSIVMLFSGLTSAYIVRQSYGEWVYFNMPKVFYFNTTLIVLSSLVFEFAFFVFKKNKIQLTQLLLFFVLSMGILFLYFQIYGWGRLVDNSVFLVGNPSGSFFYIITGLHGLHLVSGLCFIGIVSFFLQRKSVKKEKKKILLKNSIFYWHFLTFLWLYLFFFLLLYK